MYDPYAVLVLAPVFGLMVYAVSQIVIIRAAPDRSPYFSMFVGNIAGFLLSLVVTIGWLWGSELSTPNKVALFAMNFAIYLGVGFCYFNLVNIIIASLRVRMLEEIWLAGDGLPARQLLDGYNSEKVFEVRIARLLNGGHLVESDGRFVNGKKRFLWLALFWEVLRRVILGRKRFAAGRPKVPSSLRAP